MRKTPWQTYLHLSLELRAALRLVKPVISLHRLLDGAKDRTVIRVLHFDPDRIAEPHEGRLRLARADGLDRAELRDATVAEATFRDRAAWAAIRVLVRHGAGSDDRASAETPGSRGVRDERPEIEGHIRPGVRLAEQLAVHRGEQRQMDLAVMPRLAQLVGRHRHRRERRRRFGLEESEALGELGRCEV